MPWLRYAYAGGQPPETSEALSIDADGSVRYLTGNPWPEQPPYDEIGAYAGQLPTPTLDAVRDLVAAVAEERASGGDVAGGGDAGVKRLAIDEGWELAWGAGEAAGTLDPLERRLRDAIGRLRAESPEATLRAELGSGGLRLHNRGGEPFKVMSPIEVRLAESDDPVELRQAPPLRLAGEPFELKPGQTTDYDAELPPARGALVGLRWAASWPGRAELEADGWIVVRHRS